jgi:hypothetical protein
MVDQVGGVMKGTATATIDARYSFTAQFVRSSAIFARRCAEIERLNPDSVDDLTRTEHRGLVIAAIMQSTAAVEAESAELTIHGPGSHLGSNGTDTKARDLLAPLAEFIDGQETLERYGLIMHLMGKPPLDQGRQPWQHMAILVRVRNELTHYKSKWGKQMERQKLFKTLQQLGLPKPPFVPSSGMDFFPHRFLSAAAAGWSVKTAVAFLNAIYEQLQIESPLKNYMAEFKDL